MSTIYTRFPPEPNGYLHLGHLKAMLADFENSQFPVDDQDVCCYLRFDDTNPETEEQRFADAITDDVKFFGFVPWKITYTSDYFDELLELGWKLLRQGKAYVDFSTQDEIKRQRGFTKDKHGNVHYVDPINSPYRDRSVQDNERDFENMINGKYKESECCLRMKMDMQSTNPNMRDLVAFTIKYTPHYRTGRKHNVYPSYEFSHCIIDALEKIDYSYCSLEFVTRQESYFWVLKELELHLPKVYEFSRLNFENTLLSKRKIKAFISTGELCGWNDPRLFTIKGLRNRGYTASALKECVSSVNHTRNNGTLSIAYLESFIRKELDENAPRIFGVFDPLKVIIENIDENESFTFERPVHPRNPDMGTRKITFSREMWIDRSDFRVEANRKYFRLTPKKKTVRLKYAQGILEYTRHTVCKDDPDKVECIYAKYIPDTTTRVKGCISWLNAQDAYKCKFTQFLSLLNNGGEYNQDSANIKNGYIEYFDGKGDGDNNCLNVDSRYQIERFGYYIVKTLDLENKTIDAFQIVSLREDKNK